MTAEHDRCCFRPSGSPAGAAWACVRVLLPIAMVLAIAAPVSAEQGASETTSGPERRGQPTGLGFRIRGAALHQFGTDIDGGGDFDVTRTAAEASVRYAFSETSFVGLAAGFGWDGYGFLAWRSDRRP
jgi:hypothetical protein